MAFVCAHAGCGRSYQRKEHLNRHMKNHESIRSFTCPACEAKFSRGDTLRRHIALHGPRASSPPPARVSQACEHCHRNKTRCDGARPICSPCVGKSRQCLYTLRAEQEAAAAEFGATLQSPSSVIPLGGHSPIELVDGPGQAFPTISVPPSTTSFQGGINNGSKPPSLAYSHPLEIVGAAAATAPAPPVLDPPPPSIYSEDEVLLFQGSWEAGVIRGRAQRLYFEKFHRHWPLLHRATFERGCLFKPLVRAVMTIGVFFMGSPQAIALARSQANELMEDIQNRLLPSLLERIQMGQASEPTAELLPQLQAVMLPMIFSLHRRDKSADAAIALNPAVVHILKAVGVFEQSRISAAAVDIPAECPLNPALQKDSYQRLALLHFKFHLAAHALVMSLYPWVKFSRVVDPSMLNVRAPVPPSFWENPPVQWDSRTEAVAARAAAAAAADDPADDEFLVVSRIFARLAATGKRSALLPLLAWDQNFAMALDCLCSVPEGETDRQLVERLRPLVNRPMDIGPRESVLS